jgi:hypothetical protein
MSDPSFAADIRPLFRDKDRSAMLHRFDLSSLEDVRSNAQRILGVLQAGSMPCDGGWEPGKVGRFEQWIAAGMPE